MRISRRPSFAAGLLAALALTAATAAPSGAIVGGRLAGNGEYPWMAAVYFGNPGSGQFCGGTLVRPTIVISAAHCILGLPGPVVSGVLLGRNTLNGSGGEVIPALGFVIHPAWNAVNNTFDIAAIKLSRPSSAQTLDWARPGMEAYFAAGVTATVTGWGATREGGSRSNELREAEVPIVSDSDCVRSYGSLWVVPSQHLCAGYPNGGTDTCQGDSGGPLMVPGPGGRFILAGITSWGEGCARPNRPGVYSEVATLSSFIDVASRA